MIPRKPILERAFELARSGKCGSLGDLSWRLAQEGYVSSDIRGPTLRGQLRDLIKTARTAQPSFVKSRGSVPIMPEQSNAK